MTVSRLVLQVDAAVEADRALIGGKASSLIALARHGARVPPAFVLTTDAYHRWLEGGGDELIGQLIDEGIAGLQERAGRRLGSGSDGLVVSVRSGAPVSMPGMMDTILNAGMGALAPDAEPFACQARASFLLQYAQLVLELDDGLLESLRSQSQSARGAAALNEFERQLAATVRSRGQRWPESPRAELVGAARAVFLSWQSPRARLYRRMRKIDEALGTSVTIQQMVFGNRDARSGSGVAFTRDPTSGAPGLHGEFLFGGQGEEVVAGREAGCGLDEWRRAQPQCHAELEALGLRLEQSAGSVQELEFTVEQDRLYLLQCRPALLTAKACARAAVEWVGDGRMERAQALAYARAHGFRPESDSTGLAVRAGVAAMARGIAVGGGVGVGAVAFDRATAERCFDAGTPVVFIAVETAPTLLPIMRRSAALLTMRGGATSHAAVVARELGIPCVVGLGASIADGRLQLGGGVAEGERVTVDGDSGELFRGDVTIRASRLSEFEQTLRRWATASRPPPHQNGVQHETQG